MNELIERHSEASPTTLVETDTQPPQENAEKEAVTDEKEMEMPAEEASFANTPAEDAKTQQDEAADVTAPSESTDAQVADEQEATALEKDDTAPEGDGLEARANDASSEAALLAEIERLKSELARRDAQTDRFIRERAEFLELYPDADFKDLPDSVWKDVGRGVPLAAAFALFERKRFCTEQKAFAYNTLNSQRSAGGLEATPSDYYSPNEVRAMTPSEVRANYDKIMRSMQKWQ